MPLHRRTLRRRGLAAALPGLISAATFAVAPAIAQERPNDSVLILGTILVSATRIINRSGTANFRAFDQARRHGAARCD